MKFLCDAMLGHIGRKLRMAGYDTLIDRGELSDAQLLDIAARESRNFLTCDRKIQDIRAHKHWLVFLPQSDERIWVRYLTQELGVNWLQAPFTRCIECNYPLQGMPPEALRRLPFDVQQKGERGLYCPTCNKVYWEGSHVERMRKQLQQLMVDATS